MYFGSKWLIMKKEMIRGSLYRIECCGGVVYRFARGERMEHTMQPGDITYWMGKPKNYSKY